MSRTAHTLAQTAARLGVLSLLMASLAAPASATEHPRVPCSGLTVTIASIADIPTGLTVRALQEGLNYPKGCR